MSVVERNDFEMEQKNFELNDHGTKLVQTTGERGSSIFKGNLHSFPKITFNRRIMYLQ